MTSMGEETHAFDGCLVCRHEEKLKEEAAGLRCSHCFGWIEKWDLRAAGGKCGTCLSALPATGGARYGQGRTE